MTTITHLYMTLHGAYTTGEWAGETAQMGLRIYPQHVAGGAFGPYIDFERAFDVTETFNSADGAIFSTAQNWIANATTAPASVIGLSQQEALAATMHTFANALKPLTTSQFSFQSIKLAPIYPAETLLGPVGKYAAPASVFTFKAPIAGGVAGTVNMPPQDAICLSLRSPVVGRSGRGRMYVPAMVQGSCTNGLVASATRTSLVNAGKAFVNAVESLSFGADSSYRVVVCSAGSSRGVPPREVRVGDEWDTQRRREAQRKENYTTLPL